MGIPAGRILLIFYFFVIRSHIFHRTSVLPNIVLLERFSLKIHGVKEANSEGKEEQSRQNMHESGSKKEQVFHKKLQQVWKKTSSLYKWQYRE